MENKVDILKENLRRLLQRAIYEIYTTVTQIHPDAPVLSDIEICLSASSEEFLACARENVEANEFLGKMWIEIVANSSVVAQINSAQQQLCDNGTPIWVGLRVRNQERRIVKYDENFLRSLGISPI